MLGSPETGGRLGARKTVNVKLRPDSGIKESVGWKRQGLGTTGGGVRGSRARDHCACRAIWISGFPGVVLDLARLRSLRRAL